MFIFDVYWTTFYFLGCMLKFRLPNLYTIIRVSKIKKRLLKKKEKVKGFFIFMTILSFKQVEYNYSKKKPCKQGCSSIIKFSHCLSFEYCKYGFIYLFIYFFNLNSKWLYMLHAQRKKSLKWTSVGKTFSGNLEG